VKDSAPFSTENLGLLLCLSLTMPASFLPRRYKSQPIKGEATTEDANHTPNMTATVIKAYI